MSVRRNFAFRLFAEITIKVLTLGFFLVLVRVLAPEGWGALQTAWSWGGLVTAITLANLGNVATRELARAKPGERAGWVLGAYLAKLALWLGTLLLAALGLLAPGAPACSPLLLATLGLVAALSMVDFNTALFSGLERLDRDFVVVTSGKAAQVLASGIALYLGAPLVAVVLVWLAAALVAWAWGCGRVWGLVSQDPGPLGWGLAWRRAASLLRQLWPYGLTPVLALFTARFGTLLLQAKQGDAAVGYYQAASKWYEALLFFSAAFMAAALPKLVRDFGSPRGLANARRSLDLLLAAGALFGAGFAGLAPCLTFIVGPAYGPSVPVLAVLALVPLFGFTSELWRGLLLVESRQSLVLVAALVATAVNVAANLLLISRLGAVGAAWATLATELGMALAAVIPMLKAFPVGTWLPRYGRALLALAAGVGLAGLCAGHRWLGLLAAPLGTLACLWALGLAPVEELRSALDRARA
jgi:O-antigen/teichoic acid export membrane protein